MVDLAVRAGSADDLPEVLELFDEAIGWLVGRGLVGQWGEAPFSANPVMRDRIRRLLVDHEVRIAEHEGRAAGALVLGDAPPYAPPASRPELYVLLLLSARRLAGNAIGASLLELAGDMAHQRGAEQLRVDCWADSPALVRYYEGQGFVRDGRFELEGWRGQVLSRPV